jgi:hypothetical protein
MTDDFERALLGDDEIAPSSGFTETVMRAVTAEAAAPPPLPFPWLSALPIFAAAAIALGSALIAAPPPTIKAATVTTPLFAQLEVPSTPDALWTIFALTLSGGLVAAALHAHVWLPRGRIFSPDV